MDTDYDIVIIGAGIHGAGVLQAAAAKGYRCLLLEQFDHAAKGTSGRSSNLIHGGLRYLEHGEFKLVYQCLRERAQLLHNAPDLVSQRPFYLPIYDNSHRKAWQVRLSLMMYSFLSLLAGAKSSCRAIRKSQWKTLHGIRQKGLRKVFCYTDAVTDSVVLTQAVISSAIAIGGEVRFNMHFKRALKTRFGYQVFCTSARNNGSTEKTISLSTKTLVIASGPWINYAMNEVLPNPNMPEIEHVQGTHIILPGDLKDLAYHIETPDQRSVFIRPGKKGIVIGTTELVFRGDPGESFPTPREVNYLLAIFNYYLPGFYELGPACVSDMLESYAGIRVLPKNDLNPYQRSRQTIFAYDHEHHPRLVGIYGGRLTSYRNTAEKAIKKLRKHLPKAHAVANTNRIKLFKN